jgi:hypothetical protein
MRLKSAIWVSAFLRRHQVEGRYGAVIHKGAEEAGAVYVIVNHFDATMHLYGPAPGPAYDDDGERRFVVELGGVASAAAVDSLLARRRAADPDIWVIEIEDRSGTAGLSAVE